MTVFSDEQNAELAKPLDPRHVASRSQAGRTLDYIEAWFAISEANRIFGFGGWTSETVELRQVAENKRKIGQGERASDGWGVSYVCKVRVTVGDVVREGIGSGHGIDRDLGLAHESAAKEAESDARKRALMTFGNPFGLALYDKSRENVRAELIDDATRDEIAAMASGAGVPLKKICESYGIANLKELPASTVGEVKQRINQVLEDRKEKA